MHTTGFNSSVEKQFATSEVEPIVFLTRGGHCLKSFCFGILINTPRKSAGLARRDSAPLTLISALVLGRTVDSKVNGVGVTGRPLPLPKKALTMSLILHQALQVGTKIFFVGCVVFVVMQDPSPRTSMPNSHTSIHPPCLGNDHAPLWSVLHLVANWN